MIKPPDIPGVCERDIDLLLLEELWANPAFRDWFISQSVTDAVLGQLVEVKRSVTQSSGESDLELTWQQVDGSCSRLLIENKVDAGFQRDQAARYRQRAQDCVANGQCSRAWTVLVAPDAYYGSAPRPLGFDVTLTYEQVRDWFVHSRLDSRSTFKAGLLTAAINKASLGYNPIADDAVSRFWQQYWEMSVALAPELAMNRPGPKPAGSTWIYFAPAGLPSAVWLVHKFANGIVELNLGGAAKRLGDLRAVLGPALDSGMTVERTGKSASIRVQVPVLNAAQEIATQEADVRVGISAAVRVLAWARANRDAVEHAAARSA
jgi:hypothetical protein